MKRKIKMFLVIVICFLGLSIYMIGTNLFKDDCFESVGSFKTDSLIEMGTKFPLNQKKINLYDELIPKYSSDHIVAFLDIPGLLTEIEPIVQAEDNDYYLHYNIEGKKDKNGATFLDYRNQIHQDKKILIYGHSNPELSLPLSVISRYSDSSFLESHPMIYLYTKENIYEFEVFSSYVETDDFDYVNLKSFNGLTWMEHLEKLKNKSQHQTSSELKEDKKVIILQTCSQEEKYKNYERKYRLVIGIEK